MSILRNIDIVINRYLDDLEKGRIKKPDCCEICRKKCRLYWHAKYLRKLVTVCGKYEIPIKRLYCPLCKHTFALIPAFIEKFHCYGKDIIMFAVREFKKKTNIEKIANKLAVLMEAVDLYIEIPTLYRWRKKFHNI